MENVSRYLKEMIHDATGALYNFRRQNYSNAYVFSSKFTINGEKYINEAVNAGFTNSIELLLPVWQLLLDTIELGDVTEIADVYERNLLPVLYDIQNCILENTSPEPVVFWNKNMEILKNKDKKLYKILSDAKEDDSRNYIFAWAETGDPVLKVETESGIVTLHSEINPWQEAYDYCKYNSDGKIEESIIIGMGMGYHALRMSELYKYKKITILENDLEQLRILFMYTDITALLNNEKVHIKYVSDISDYKDILSKIDNSKECLIWYPAIKTIKDREIREFLENYWVNLNSIKNHGDLLDRNFSKNIKACCYDNANILKDCFSNKKMILIAGGPSLDNDMDILKKISDDKEKYKDSRVITAVGKVAKKLITNGIIPDYIIMTDPKAGTLWQIRGIEKCGVPLIALSTTSSDVIEGYKGRCYLAFQEGFEPAEKYAEENSISTFSTGGSVATFAIDFGIRMECAEIICVGMDMAYTNNMTHTLGIGKEIKNINSLRIVKSVDGDMIYTSKTLDMYRRWIEDRIQKEKKIRFINTSKGAKINGMREISLSEVI